MHNKINFVIFLLLALVLLLQLMIFDMGNRTLTAVNKVSVAQETQTKSINSLVRGISKLKIPNLRTNYMSKNLFNDKCQFVLMLRHDDEFTNIVKEPDEEPYMVLTDQEGEEITTSL